MKVIYSHEKTYVLRILRGENVVEKLTEFCSDQNINSGWIQGLGAVDYARISYYDLAQKEYIQKEIHEECELLSLMGNIALSEGSHVVHAHVTLGKQDYSTIGGHLHEMKVSGTCEIYLTAFEGEFTRSSDPDTGLKLLD